jgi:hypothetical protein
MKQLLYLTTMDVIFQNVGVGHILAAWVAASLLAGRAASGVTAKKLIDLEVPNSS